MVSMTGEYLGSLRTQDTHLLSGNKIITDAPPDNNGKGEAFSPTDLVCAALNSCMMTLIGMSAAKEKIDITGMRSEITKIMQANPRKISEIQISFSLPGLVASDIQKEKFKKAALECPVALSISENIKQTITFDF